MTATVPDRGRFSAALGWALAARQADRLIGIVSISLLSRLLAPRDFGLVAMAGAIAALTEVLTAFGFDWALVRVSQPTREHYDTAWTLRLIAGQFTFVVLAVIAYPLSLFYQQPAVINILLVMGLNAIIASLENIAIVDFRREMRFDVEFKVRLIGKIAGFVCALNLAYWFHTYWALVLGITASRAASVLATYLIYPYRPAWSLKRRAELLSFSVWTLLSAIVDSFRSKFAEIYIGRSMGAQSVGFYSMAAELSSVAATEIAAPINRVAFSKYTKEARVVESLRKRYLEISGLIWALGLPAAVGIGVCANEIVRVLLGAQWDDAVPVLQILAAAGVIAIMAANTHYVYLALGRAKFVTALDVLATSVFVLSTLALGRGHGLLAVAFAQVLAGIAALAVNYAVLMRTLSISLRDIAANQWRVVVASCAMGFIVLQSVNTLGLQQSAAVVRLVTMIAVGCVVYALSVAVLWMLSGRPKGSEERLFVTCNEALRHIRDKYL